MKTVQEFILDKRNEENYVSANLSSKVVFASAMSAVECRLCLEIDYDIPIVRREFMIFPSNYKRIPRIVSHVASYQYAKDIFHVYEMGVD